MRLWVSLLGVDEVGEFGGVSNKEHRCVVEDPVKIAFIGPHLNGETSRITSGVGGARFAANGGEAHGCTDLLSNGCEERTGRDIAQVMSELEVTMGTGSFSVHLPEVEWMRNVTSDCTYNSLRDTLAIEVCKEVNVVEILAKHRTH